MQSIPLGSSFENTKQLNASLNSSPQGPCAIPPKQGQSQFISPVSGLNAPSSSACPSRSATDTGRSDGSVSFPAFAAVWFVCGLAAVDVGGGESSSDLDRKETA